MNPESPKVSLDDITFHIICIIFLLINNVLINRHNKTKHPAQGTRKEMFSCIRLGSR